MYQGNEREEILEEEINGFCRNGLKVSPRPLACMAVDKSVHRVKVLNSNLVLGFRSPETELRGAPAAADTGMDAVVWGDRSTESGAHGEDAAGAGIGCVSS